MDTSQASSSNITGLSAHNLLGVMWVTLGVTRRDRFQADRQRQLELHGEEVVHMMETFYTAVAGLFTGGRLGGVRITGSKAPNNKES